MLRRFLSLVCHRGVFTWANVSIILGQPVRAKAYLPFSYFVIGSLTEPHADNFAEDFNLMSIRVLYNASLNSPLQHTSLATLR